MSHALRARFNALVLVAVLLVVTRNLPVGNGGQGISARSE